MVSALLLVFRVIRALKERRVRSDKGEAWFQLDAVEVFSTK